MAATGSDALEITLDRDADVPLGVQLAWALRARILAGSLAAGDRLPALHKLAAETGVNANTIRAVYQRLEQDGLVSTRHGSGTFVTAAAAAANGRAATRVAVDAARAARAAGVDPREVAAALYVSGEASASVTAAAEDADARGRLRAQIAALEHALSGLAARRPAARDPLAEPPAATPRPRLPSAAELAHERDELLRRLAEAHLDG